jgi:protein SCO1/2
VTSPTGCAVRRTALAAVAAAAAMLLGGCGGSSAAGPVSDVTVHDSDGLHGTVLPTPYRVPAVSLTDTTGAPYDLATKATKPLTLVFFGYSHCPDICQVVMADIASALTRLDAAHRRKVAMVFVTTDPKRDTSKVLKAYVRRFDPTFQGVTGSLPRIVRLGKAFDVPIETGAKLPSGGYDVVHGTNVVAVTPDRTAPYVWTQGTSPADMAADLVKILDGKVHAQ